MEKCDCLLWLSERLTSVGSDVSLFGEVAVAAVSFVLIKAAETVVGDE